MTTITFAHCHEAYTSKDKFSNIIVIPGSTPLNSVEYTVGIIGAGDDAKGSSSLRFIRKYASRLASTARRSRNEAAVAEIAAILSAFDNLFLSVVSEINFIGF